MSNRTSDQADKAVIRLKVERLQDRANFQVFKARTAKRLLADIQELAPVITARVAEIEAGRRIPQDLVQALRSIGVFRLFVPRSHGGMELDLPTALGIIGALARIDGSVGWTAMTGNGGQLFTPLLPRETYDQAYRNGPDVLVAGVSQPAGTAEKTEGGWRVNGRWPFASGCLHATGWAASAS
jgi:indole-3-acetate monooxygenase